MSLQTDVLPWWAYNGRQVVPFKPAPRTYCGNMCGIRLPGAPAVSGGADDASLILSWFYDRYSNGWRSKIRDAWKAKGYVDVLLSWPDSRAAGQSPAQFLATCQELIAQDFYPCPMLYSKDFDPSDVPAILASLEPLIKLLIGVVPRVCIGWELSIALTPTQVQQLIDAIAPRFTPAGTKVYVHFQEGYFAFQQPGESTASFWWTNIGKLTGILRQRNPDEDVGNPAEYQARIQDCLSRFSGGFNFPTDSGFGHPFDLIELEITASQQFNGSMAEWQGDDWGTAAISTPAIGGVSVMGSGNGQTP